MSFEATEYIFPSFGILPWYAHDYVDRFDEIAELCKNAIMLGEIGLDEVNARDKACIPDQRPMFEIFLKSAETFVDIVASEKEPILVHCYAGNDRTGAMLACFLISQGMPADKAISEVRRLNPTAMVTPGYEDVVYQFAALHTERI